MKRPGWLRIGGSLSGFAVAVLLLCPVLAGAQEGRLVEEVGRMLEAQLSEEIILEWIETEEPPREPLSADDLIALKSAGASEDLLRRLLRYSRDTDAASPERATAAAPPPGDTAAGELSVAPSLAETDGAGALTTVVLSYLSRVEYPDPEWDLYVYVDGVPVSYVTADGLQATPRRLEFARQVPAGRHQIRVTQERHVRRGSRWEHQARVAAETFWFDLAADQPARIEIQFVERLMDYSNPVMFKLVQGDSVVDSGRVGGEAEFWPLLCEDIEASVPAGKEPGRQQRRQLEECVRWETLWSEIDAPSRQEVLDAMSPFDYRPLPKGS